jgi:hypothetical protein
MKALLAELQLLALSSTSSPPPKPKSIGLIARETPDTTHTTKQMSSAIALPSSMPALDKSLTTTALVMPSQPDALQITVNTTLMKGKCDCFDVSEGDKHLW